MILFLDFDGVLHPSEVFLEKGEPVLRWPECSLFCWAPILESILDDHDPAGDIKIILSTSWVPQFGMKKSVDRLPEGLRDRVIGSVYPRKDLPRGEHIAWHARQEGIDDWIAIDDDAFKWPQEHRHRLVCTDGWTGLSESSVIEELKDKLDGAIS